jgi:iron complex outermembrane receptor protein
MLTLTSAFAQTDQEVSDVRMLEEIVVTGIKRSLDSAAEIKRESNVMVDAITSEDIGLFSDNNIAEALQRIPGVLLEREAGEGYRVSIRGLGPRYVRTTINGRSALSDAGGENADGDDARAFKLNTIPSEVISGATVAKSTQAMDIEGGIGGVVDLQTIRPLEFALSKDQDLYVSGAVRATYNDLLEETLPRGTVFLNKKFSDNFGLFFAATIDSADRQDNLSESQTMFIQDHDLRAGTILNGELLTADLSNQNYAIFRGVRYQDQHFERDRDTYTGGLQWQSGNWDINFDWTHVSEDELADDLRLWFDTGNSRQDERFITSITVDTNDALPDQAVPSLGTVTRWEFEGIRRGTLMRSLYRRLPRTSEQNVGGLNVAWANEDWTIEGDLGFADTKTDRILERFRGNLDFSDPSRADGVSGSFDISSGFPIVQLFDSFGSPVDPLDPATQSFDLIEKSFKPHDAEEISTRFDFTKQLTHDFWDQLHFGFVYSEAELAHSHFLKDERTGWDLDGVRVTLAENILNDVNVPGYVHSFVIPDVTDPRFADYLASPDGYFLDVGGTFNINEDTTSLYLQGSFSGEGRMPYRGNIGVRYVDTKQSNSGPVGIGNFAGFVPADPANPNVTTDRSYSEALPSANIAFDWGDDKVLRFAANQALTRPDPIDLSARLELDTLDDDDDLTGEGGNPDLEAYKTTSFDVSLEFYPERGGAYAVGVFYKKLDGWISSGSGPELIAVSDGAGGLQMVEYDISRPVNTDGGDIKGVEFSFHTPLDFLGEFWSDFGITGSFTYVDAQIDAVVPSRGVPISLRGTSEKSGNLVAYYEHERWSARVAYNFRDDFLFQEASADDRFDEYTVGEDIVDVNVDFVLNDHVRFRFTAANLTESRRERYWDSPGKYYSDLRDNGRNFILEARFTY